MRRLSLVALALCFACGTAPQKPDMASPSTKASAAPSSSDSTEGLTIDEEQARQIMETADVAVDTQVAAETAPAAEPQAQPAAASTQPVSGPVDFMSATESGISQSLAAMSNSRGETLPEAKVQALTNSIMGVVQAAKKKNPFAVAGAWNSFVKTAREMNKEAAAANPAISVQGILDLAADIVGILPDLIKAVLDGDIPGIINAAIDLIAAIIDFIN